MDGQLYRVRKGKGHRSSCGYQGSSYRFQLIILRLFIFLSQIKDIIDNSIPYDRDVSFFLDRTVYNPNISNDGIITINPKDKQGKQTWQRGRVYDIEGNCPTICASLFDLNITKDHKTYRKLTIEECERLQGVPKGYTSVVKKNVAGEMLGNGWTVDVIAHIFKGLKN